MQMIISGTEQEALVVSFAQSLFLCGLTAHLVSKLSMRLLRD